MLFLTESHIRSLLPMADAVRIMRDTFQALAAGQAQNQPRRRLILPTGSVLHSLAGAYGNYFGTKIYSTHPKHGANFFFLLFDAATANPLAMMEANYLGQIRTGAASGYATDLLAAHDAHTLAIIGSGFQARSQLDALLCVRQFSEIRVWSRNPAACHKFADECAAVSKAPVHAVDSAEAAVRGADVIVTATNAKDPVLDNAWIAPGAHINAMGSNNPQRRELPPELIARARFIAVDSIEQARIEAGDLMLAWSNLAESNQDWNSPRLVELQTLAAHPPAHAATGVTIFKSLGLGVEDVAAGAFVYERARELGLGA
ncbi:MAG: ornithine cyclodeaminase family protein [Bryobacteraceae bacterium]